jgi:hypothetical protein
MGATGWIYFTPYQSDVEKALQELREQVFHSGRYEYHIGQALDLSAIDKWDAEGNARFQEMVEAARQRAKTIDGLLEVVDYSGTHSILDVRHTSDTPGHDVICSASQSQLMDWFGTGKPTRKTVEDNVAAFYDEAYPIFFVIYKDDVPDEFCFSGTTGH